MLLSAPSETFSAMGTAMRRSDAIALLLAHADELGSAGVAHVALFGWVARDSAGPSSDVDLGLPGPPGRPMTLFSRARRDPPPPPRW
jgi:predicted nucleotidyltransferase